MGRKVELCVAWTDFKGFKSRSVGLRLCQVLQCLTLAAHAVVAYFIRDIDAALAQVKVHR